MKKIILIIFFYFSAQWAWASVVLQTEIFCINVKKNVYIDININDIIVQVVPPYQRRSSFKLYRDYKLIQEGHFQKEWPSSPSGTDNGVFPFNIYQLYLPDKTLTLTIVDKSFFPEYPDLFEKWENVFGNLQMHTSDEPIPVYCEVFVTSPEQFNPDEFQ